MQNSQLPLVQPAQARGLQQVSTLQQHQAQAQNVQMRVQMKPDAQTLAMPPPLPANLQAYLQSMGLPTELQAPRYDQANHLKTPSFSTPAAKAKSRTLISAGSEQTASECQDGILVRKSSFRPIQFFDPKLLNFSFSSDEHLAEKHRMKKGKTIRKPSPYLRRKNAKLVPLSVSSVSTEVNPTFQMLSEFKKVRKAAYTPISEMEKSTDAIQSQSNSEQDEAANLFGKSYGRKPFSEYVENAKETIIRMRNDYKKVERQLTPRERQLYTNRIAQQKSRLIKRQKQEAEVARYEHVLGKVDCLVQLLATELDEQTQAAIIAAMAKGTPTKRRRMEEKNRLEIAMASFLARDI